MSRALSPGDQVRAALAHTPSGIRDPGTRSPRLFRSRSRGAATSRSSTEAASTPGGTVAPTNITGGAGALAGGAGSGTVISAIAAWTPAPLHGVLHHLPALAHAAASALPSALRRTDSASTGLVGPARKGAGAGDGGEEGRAYRQLLDGEEEEGQGQLTARDDEGEGEAVAEVVEPPDPLSVQAAEVVSCLANVRQLLSAVSHAEDTVHSLSLQRTALRKDLTAAITNCAELQQALNEAYDRVGELESVNARQEEDITRLVGLLRAWQADALEAARDREREREHALTAAAASALAAAVPPELNTALHRSISPTPDAQPPAPAPAPAPSLSSSLSSSLSNSISNSIGSGGASGLVAGALSAAASSAAATHIKALLSGSSSSSHAAAVTAAQASNTVSPPRLPSISSSHSHSSLSNGTVATPVPLPPSAATLTPSGLPSTAFSVDSGAVPSALLSYGLSADPHAHPHPHAHAGGLPASSLAGGQPVPYRAQWSASLATLQQLLLLQGNATTAAPAAVGPALDAPLDWATVVEQLQDMLTAAAPLAQRQLLERSAAVQSRALSDVLAASGVSATLVQQQAVQEMEGLQVGRGRHGSRRGSADRSAAEGADPGAPLVALGPSSPPAPSRLRLMPAADAPGALPRPREHADGSEAFHESLRLAATNALPESPLANIATAGHGANGGFGSKRDDSTASVASSGSSPGREDAAAEANAAADSSSGVSTPAVPLPAEYFNYPLARLLPTTAAAATNSTISSTSRPLGTAADGTPEVAASPLEVAQPQPQSLPVSLPLPAAHEYPIGEADVEEAIAEAEAAALERGSSTGTTATRGGGGAGGGGSSGSSRLSAHLTADSRIGHLHPARGVSEVSEAQQAADVSAESPLEDAEAAAEAELSLDAAGILSLHAIEKVGAEAAEARERADAQAEQSIQLQNRKHGQQLALVVPRASAAATTAAATAAAAVPSIPRALRPRGLRILTLDGGGIRGLLMVQMLKKIEADSGRPIHELFDLVVGTSTGGMLALALACRKSLEDISAQYWRVRDTFEVYSAVWSQIRRMAVGTSHSTQAAESVLQSFFGALRMDDLPLTPKVAVVTAALDSLTPCLLRNYELQPSAAAATHFLGTSRVSVADAARAATAAPLFLEPALVGRSQLVDGAILADNPSLIALCEASTLWPNVPVDLMVSLGTGTLAPKAHPPAGVLGWVKALVEISMSPDTVHAVTATLLGPRRYFRFDVEGQGDVDLGEVRLNVLRDMLESGRRYCHRNEARFAELAEALGCGPSARAAARARARARARAAAVTTGAAVANGGGAGAGAGAGAGGGSGAPAPAATLPS